HVFVGLMPFTASVATYPALLWVLVKYRNGPRRTIRIGLVLMVLYGFHLVGWAVGALTVILFAMFPVDGPGQGGGSKPQTRWSDLAAVALTAPVLLFVAPHGFHIHYFSAVNHFKSLLAYTVWPLARSAGIPMLIGISCLFGISLWQAVRGRTDK